MKFLITSSLIIGAVFLLGTSTSSNAIGTQPLIKSSYDSNIIKVKHGSHGHGHHRGHGHGHHGDWNRGWGGGWGGGFYGGPGYYYGGPGYYAAPGPGLCVGPLCVF